MDEHDEYRPDVDMEQLPQFGAGKAQRLPPPPADPPKSFFEGHSAADARMQVRGKYRSASAKYPDDSAWNNSVGGEVIDGKHLHWQQIGRVGQREKRAGAPVLPGEVGGVGDKQLALPSLGRDRGVGGYYNMGGVGAGTQGGQVGEHGQVAPTSSSHAGTGSGSRAGRGGKGGASMPQLVNRGVPGSSGQPSGPGGAHLLRDAGSHPNQQNLHAGAAYNVPPAPATDHYDHAQQDHDQQRRMIVLTPRTAQLRKSKHNILPPNAELLHAVVEKIVNVAIRLNVLQTKVTTITDQDDKYGAQIQKLQEQLTILKGVDAEAQDDLNSIKDDLTSGKVISRWLMVAAKSKKAGMRELREGQGELAEGMEEVGAMGNGTIFALLGRGSHVGQFHSVCGGRFLRRKLSSLSAKKLYSSERNPPAPGLSRLIVLYAKSIFTSRRTIAWTSYPCVSALTGVGAGLVEVPSASHARVGASPPHPRAWRSRSGFYRRVPVSC